jgi:hypothetical protein
MKIYEQPAQPLPDASPTLITLDPSNVENSVQLLQNNRPPARRIVETISSYDGDSLHPDHTDDPFRDSMASGEPSVRPLWLSSAHGSGVGASMRLTEHADSHLATLSRLTAREASAAQLDDAFDMAGPSDGGTFVDGGIQFLPDSEEGDGVPLRLLGVVMGQDSTIRVGRTPTKAGLPVSMRVQAANHVAFAGLMSRSEVERLLQGTAAGTYLIRLSGTVESTVLSFVDHRGGVQHIKLTLQGEAVFLDRHPLPNCRSLEEAVALMCASTKVLGTRLVGPPPRLGSFLDADELYSTDGGRRPSVSNPIRVTRKQAEQALAGKPDGAFVLRRRQEQGSFALSVAYARDVTHHLLTYDSASLCYLLNEQMPLPGATVAEAVLPLYHEVGAGLPCLLTRLIEL